MEEQRKNFTFGGTGGTGKNRAGGTGNPKNTVVIKYRHALLGHLLMGCLCLFGAGCFASAIKGGGKDADTFLYLIVAGFAILGIICFITPFARSIVFHNNGITKKVKISLFGVTLVDRSTTILTWNSVIAFNCVSEKMGGWSFYIKYTKPRGLFKEGIFQIRPLIYTNYEDSLRYSVGKIPARLFSDRAVDKLKEMGIRFSSEAAAGTGGTGNKKPEKSPVLVPAVVAIAMFLLIYFIIPSFIYDAELVTIDGNGITTKSGSTQWNAVTKIDYEFGGRRRSSKFLIYSNTGNTIRIYDETKKGKEWVKIMVQNLPNGTILTGRAQFKLDKMGIPFKLAKRGVRADD